MPANNSKRPHAEMDSSNFNEDDSGLEDNANEQDIIWTIEHSGKLVLSSRKRIRNLSNKAQT